MSNPDSILCADDCRSFASVAAIVAAFESGGVCFGMIARRVMTMSDGLMQIKTASNSTARDWYFTANVPEDVQFTGFAVTGATLTMLPLCCKNSTIASASPAATECVTSPSPRSSIVVEAHP